MCFGQPAKSLEIARERMTPEQWAKFEADFEHFCAYSGLHKPPPSPQPYDYLTAVAQSRFDWAKWAYFSAGPY